MEKSKAVNIEMETEYHSCKMVQFLKEIDGKQRKVVQIYKDSNLSEPAVEYIVPE